MNRKKVYKEYIREIKLLFPTIGSKEKKYITYLENNIRDYCTGLSEDNNFNINVLYETFGNPKDVFIEYIENHDTLEFVKNIKKRTLIKRILITIVFIIFSLTIVWSTVLIHESITLKKYIPSTQDSIILNK